MRKEVLLVSVLVVVVVVGLSYGLITGNVVFDSDGSVVNGDDVIFLMHMDGDVLDSSGKGYHGSIVGDVDCSVDGKFGKGCEFDGVGDAIALGNVDMIGGLNEMTVSAWAYSYIEESSRRRIISQDYVFGLAVFSGGGDFQFMLDNTDGDRVKPSSGEMAQANRWYHVVGVYTGSEAKIYVDGVLEKSLTISGGVASSQYTAAVGAYNSGGAQSWNGILDEVVIWDRALLEGEILELYNAVPSVEEPEVCVEEWSCSDWGTCVNSVQNRGCVDGNGCGTVVNRPEEERSCVSIWNETVVGNESVNETVKEEIIGEETQPDDSGETEIGGIGEGVVEEEVVEEEIVRDERNVVERVVDGVVGVVENVFGFFVGLFGAQDVGEIYVDNDGGDGLQSGCDDSILREDNDIDNPFCTIQRAADVVEAGDTVNVRGGTYVDTSRMSILQIEASGTETERITFTRYQDEVVVLDAVNQNCFGITIGKNAPDEIYGNYVTVEGFTIKNVNGWDPTCTFASGVLVLGADDAIVRNNHIYRDDYPGYPDAMLPLDKLYHGINIRGHAKDTIVEYNTVHHVWQGIYARTGTNLDVGGIPERSILRWNHLYDVSAESDQGGAQNFAMGLGFSSGIVDGIAEHNLVHHGMDNGIATNENPGGHIIRNNIVYLIDPLETAGNGRGIKTKAGTTEYTEQVYNNIVFMSDVDGFEINVFPDFVGANIYNNIAYKNDKSGFTISNPQLGNPEQHSIVKNNIALSNCVEGPDDCGDVRYDADDSSVDYNFIGDGDLGVGGGNTHSEIGDPEFMNLGLLDVDSDGDLTPDILEPLNYPNTMFETPGGNIDTEAAILYAKEKMIEVFGLQATSRAIDAGTDVGLTEDFNGDSIPIGSGFDIGPYESNYVGGTCTIDIECADAYACSVDSCVSGSCVSDMGPCLCGQADVNGDGDVNVLDLSFVALSFNAGDLLGDVNGDGEVDVLDMVFVASRIDVC